MSGRDIPRPPEWMRDALCAQVGDSDSGLWFPEKGGTTRPAKSICRACTVRAECLDYSLANRERFGIWGGLSERERRPLLPADDEEEEAA